MKSLPSAHGNPRLLRLAALAACFLMFPASDARVDLSGSVLRKIDKALLSLWPGRNVTREAVRLPAEKTGGLSFHPEEGQLFYIREGSELKGYLWLADAPGRYDKFDYMIVFRPDLSILTTQVLVYREDYGGEIGSRKWLSQFAGKSGSDRLEFGRDILNISGATISARSITEGIRRITVRIRELREAGIF